MAFYAQPGMTTRPSYEPSYQQAGITSARPSDQRVQDMHDEDIARMRRTQGHMQADQQQLSAPPPAAPSSATGGPMLQVPPPQQFVPQEVAPEPVPQTPEEIFLDPGRVRSPFSQALRDQRDAGVGTRDGVMTALEQHPRAASAFAQFLGTLPPEALDMAGIDRANALMPQPIAEESSRNMPTIGSRTTQQRSYGSGGRTRNPDSASSRMGSKIRGSLVNDEADETEDEPNRAKKPRKKSSRK